ncbi:MAG TPA: FAD-dependent oxidoreductase, partial [Stellaceae bacterium]|nr:FAD-dependent oxidoreductase [Stellaceae bacterium]
MADSYDVIVIGSGPGGYVAAIRAAQLGMSVACVEKRPTLGGTCLNIGCIPSKALLQSSERYVETQHALSVHGITVGDVGLDLAKMMARKDKVVTENTRGVEFLFRKNKVDRIAGAATLVAPGKIAVAGRTVTAARAIILATGSDSIALPGIEIDE